VKTRSTPLITVYVAVAYWAVSVSFPSAVQEPLMPLTEVLDLLEKENPDDLLEPKRQVSDDESEEDER